MYVYQNSLTVWKGYTSFRFHLTETPFKWENNFINGVSNNLYIFKELLEGSVDNLTGDQIDIVRILLHLLKMKTNDKY